VEGTELDDAFDDDAKSLRAALEHELYTDLIKEQLGEELFNSYLKTLKELEIKEESTGLFKAIDVIDKRTDEERGDLELHEGYKITAGNRGSKLSGG